MMDKTNVVIVSPSDDDGNVQCKSKQYLTEKLDRAEILIESIRREALKMAEDLDNVYTSVDAVRNCRTLNYLNDGKFRFTIVVFFENNIIYTLLQLIKKISINLPIVLSDVVIQST